MELKLYSTTARIIAHLLLIVPYGIETNGNVGFLIWEYLLIVPYGIETRNIFLTLESSSLLIVPYGIETKQKSCVPPER